MKSILRMIKRCIRRGLGISFDAANIQRQIEIVRNETAEAKMLVAKVLLSKKRHQYTLETIQDAEFKVFSQFGDDGIIQYLIGHLVIEPREFIEFGVQNYEESNTRFLLINNNWRGLVIEANKWKIKHIKKDNISCRHDLTAVCAFVDRDNINDIFLENGFTGEIGILSIDIDGNDYWVWDAINVVDPILVFVEYNSIFGDKHAITIPYDTKFSRTEAHYSNLYYGASLKALCILAEKKGYSFVGSNSAGNNAYFVRKDKMGALKALSVQEGYVISKFRESRNQRGELTYISGKQRIQFIADMPVYDIERGVEVKIRDLFEEDMTL